MSARRELDVLVISTGAANLASVFAAAARLGARPRLVERPEEIINADAVILPGVGAFGPAMKRLCDSGLDEAIVARVGSGAPTLAICLGMQLLCSGSEEAPESVGIGVIPGRLRRFPNAVRTPQMGWNEVSPDSGCALLTPGHAYFANSYRLSEAPPGWSVARTDHGGPFISAMERGAVLACQFHPELSGRWGLGLLDRWLARAAAEREIRC